MSDLDAALAKSRTAAAARFNHGTFGRISTADYVRFQALHTLHHTKQIPA